MNANKNFGAGIDNVTGKMPGKKSFDVAGMLVAQLTKHHGMSQQQAVDAMNQGIEK